PGGDRAAPPDLRGADGAARRVLPREAGERRRDPRRASGRGRLRGDPRHPRAGGCADVIIRKSPQEIEQMARAGRVVADTLALIGEHIRPGVTTAELDALAEEFVTSQGGYPTFKG